MYQSADSLPLPYIKQQPLPRRYESDEEDISEPELGGQENAFSPVESYKACDSDASADELSNADPSELNMDKAGYPCLLSPLSTTTTTKASRPVSMDTVKRSSNTTFVADSYIFDHDDDVIIELPSPDSTSPLHSPVFLQPNVYVPPESPALSRRSSSSSVYSDDDDNTDVLVAEQVTYVEPIAKPNIILISPTGPSPTSENSVPPALKSAPLRPSDSSSKPFGDGEGVYSLQSAASSQPFLGSFNREARSRKSGLRLNTTDLEGSYDIPTPQLTQSPEPSSTLSMRARSMTFSRPKTAISEKVSSFTPTTRSRAPTESLRRPPSIQSIRSANFPFFHGRHHSTFPAPDNSHARPFSCSQSAASSEYSMSPQNSRPPSRTPSPGSQYYSGPNFTRHRSSSSYSVSSVPASHSSRNPLPIRNSIMKSSTASSVYSSSSLRSEVDSLRSLDPNDVAETDGKRKLQRKKSLRLFKEPKVDSPEQTTKSFMGFLRAKRKSTLKSPNA
ncbi:hypothetical protein P170DRAFT_433880 [Aspergillus steynii IBT 23096]|uniref:Uncharacterized protein n=1 Tax=Aspergillus steynii IBT 23096 TaxID=1392250 RepID=A0A2I2GGH3_9EURO|nr:uncharacterized protein P170DRAFT_433880 [Aspergillus steynii IBT 23096]PLB51983.1 hypothetical protein P170DRAFT_433880 [Aspergillus steynii IBT 23096]